MKKYLMLSIAVLALSAGAAYAEEGHRGEHKGERAAMMFDEADTNDDGLLSKEEFLARHEKKFVEIDTNADGQLSKEEMEARRKEWAEKVKERREGKAAEDGAAAPVEEAAPAEGAAE